MEPATTVAGAIPLTRTCGPSLIDEFANQVIESRLAGVVGLAAFLGNHSVGGTGKHHGGWQALVFEYPLGLPGKKIIAGDIDEECLCPLCVGEFAVGAGHGIDRGGVDDDVDAAELRDREIRRLRKGGGRN